VDITLIGNLFAKRALAKLVGFVFNGDVRRDVRVFKNIVSRFQIFPKSKMRRGFFFFESV